jgi:PAS domain S-box-containing protein
MADAVIFADRRGTIRHWNPAAAALLGHSADAVLGRSLDLIIPEHLRAAQWRGFDAAMNNAALKLEGRPTLTRGLHKSRRKLYVEMTFALVSAAGAVGVMTLAMMTRATLGHSGRPRRVEGAADFALPLMNIAAVAWILAFAAFLVV